MDKTQIIAEIRRIAAQNSGTPPGSRQFYKETQTRESTWKNKHWNDWNNWGDALEEAGFARLMPTEKFNSSLVLEHLATLTRKLGRFPITIDMRREKRVNDGFPNDKVISSMFGGRRQALPALIQFCEAAESFSDILPVLKSTVLTVGFRKLPEPIEYEGRASSAADETSGFVYLLKIGKYYKLGYTSAPFHRFSTLIKQSATGGEPIHHFATDDPRGIEAYWQNRFKNQKVKAINKTSGESYKLSQQDVAAFKRRQKFM